MARQTQKDGFRARRSWSCEAGQAALLSVVWMVVLLGMAGLVIDVGSWYRSQRSLQAKADASALAGAQDLPNDTSAAAVDAHTYATKNGLNLPLSDISFSNDLAPNDSITVKADDSAPTFFTKIFGLSSVAVSASATARSSLIGQARWVAPITVNINHPLLSGVGADGKPCPCFDVPTVLPLDKRGAPGAFGLIDLNGTSGNGASTLGNWIQYGYDGYLGLGPYSSNTGASFNSSNIQTALAARKGTVLLFPVYDSLTGQGTNGVYNVVAWVAFKLTGYQITGGNSGELDGYFTDITWDGIPATSGNSVPDLGARVVTLTQ